VDCGTLAAALISEERRLGGGKFDQNSGSKRAAVHIKNTRNGKK
jgi:hypothetical protein